MKQAITTQSRQPDLRRPWTGGLSVLPPRNQTITLYPRGEMKPLPQFDLRNLNAGNLGTVVLIYFLETKQLLVS